MLKALLTTRGHRKQDSTNKIIWDDCTRFTTNTLRKSNSNHVSCALPYSSTACG